MHGFTGTRIPKEENINSDHADPCTTTVEEPPRVTRLKTMQDSRDTPLYHGMDARQQRELNRPAPYLHTASDSDEEYESGDEDTTGWDLEPESAIAGTSFSSDHTVSHAISVPQSYDEATRSKYARE